MMRIREAPRWLLTGLLFLTANTAVSEELNGLKPFSAEYTLSHGYLELASVKVSLKLSENGEYVYRAHTLPTGLTAVLHRDEITEISRGRIVGTQVRPSSYRYLHEKPSKPRQVELKFDWSKMQVTNSTPESRWQMKLKPGTQDKFSQQLRLMIALIQGHRKIEFPVADGGLMKSYRFHIEKEEMLETALGSVRALKAIRSKNARPSQASLWLSPDLNYLPVRVERKEKDGEYSMRLTHIRWE